MTECAIVKTDGSSEAAVKAVLRAMLTQGLLDAVLVPARTPYSPLPMPTLIADPEKLDSAMPLAPAAPFNAARQAAAVARKPLGKKIAVVLRPCEIRALVELVKLKQCTLEKLLVIGLECLGRMENDVFLAEAKKHDDVTSSFYTDDTLQTRVTETCDSCNNFLPKGSDITIAVLGMKNTHHIGLLAETEEGKQILKALGYPDGVLPQEREEVIKNLLIKRRGKKEALFANTAEKLKSMERAQEIWANCLNCYNCRVACPVCYCKECVFLTDVFAHDPAVLLRRAAKKGAIKIPTDTSMFHMTRLAHMAHACVGCGHCSSVCPSHIPVSDIFRTVAAQTQALFDYEAGRDILEPIPYLVFEKKE
jgi:formate dehydrogenase subunit beta